VLSSPGIGASNAPRAFVSISPVFASIGWVFNRQSWWSRGSAHPPLGFDGFNIRLPTSATSIWAGKNDVLTRSNSFLQNKNYFSLFN
jgi:hypothetical protein